MQDRAALLRRKPAALRRASPGKVVPDVEYEPITIRRLEPAISSARDPGTWPGEHISPAVPGRREWHQSHWHRLSQRHLETLAGEQDLAAERRRGRRARSQPGPGTAAAEHRQAAGHAASLAPPRNPAACNPGRPSQGISPLIREWSPAGCAAAPGGASAEPGGTQGPINTFHSFRSFPVVICPVCGHGASEEWQ
jgi:hypothetical protein